jgi:hypothetical protein
LDIPVGNTIGQDAPHADCAAGCQIYCHGKKRTPADYLADTGRIGTFLPPSTRAVQFNNLIIVPCINQPNLDIMYRGITTPWTGYPDDN